LYFDIELKKPGQLGITTERLIRELTQAVRRVVSSQGGEAGDPEVLDASTPEKLSLHVIFTNVVAENNRALKAKVQLVIDDLKQHGCHLTAQSIDTGVYTRNRNMRTLWSSKARDNGRRALTHPEGMAPSEDLVVLWRRCLCTATGDEPLLWPYMGAAVAGIAWSAPDLRVVPEIAVLLNFGVGLLAPNGRIYSIAYRPQSTWMSCAIDDGCRFCAIAGREHHRNHIRVVFDLNSGLAWQMCFSARCARKGYPADGAPIPGDLLTPARKLLLPDFHGWKRPAWCNRSPSVRGRQELD
jgi:hypothetical protein